MTYLTIFTFLSIHCDLSIISQRSVYLFIYFKRYPVISIVILQDSKFYVIGGGNNHFGG